jgi:hypothetical protein
MLLWWAEVTSSCNMILILLQGLAGTRTAHMLTKAGYSVLVLEAKNVGLINYSFLNIIARDSVEELSQF